MKLRNFEQQGFTLIEILIATGVVTMVMVGISSGVSFAVKNARYSQQKALSVKHAQESLEWLRAQRDVVGWKAFYEILSEEPASTFSYCLNEIPVTSEAFRKLQSITDSRVPDYAIGILTLATLSYRFILVVSGEMRSVDFFLSIISALLASAAFLLLFVGTRGRGIGFGDVKFAIPMGLLLGFPKVLVGFFLSFLIGGVVGVVLLLTGKRRFGQTVPFGPFLILGLVSALIWGGSLWSWYMELLSY